MRGLGNWRDEGPVRNEIPDHVVGEGAGGSDRAVGHEGSLCIGEEAVHPLVDYAVPHEHTVLAVRVRGAGGVVLD